MTKLLFLLLGVEFLLMAPAHAQSTKHHRHSTIGTPTPAPDDTPVARSKPSPTPTPTPSPAKLDSTDKQAVPEKNGHANVGGAAVSTIEPGEIKDFDAQPEPVRHLLTTALDLTKRNLTYTYGSDDPGSGGMDCSGTIYYLLRQSGFGDVPRQASEQYAWVRRQARFYAVLSKKEDSFELNEMRPGDLLFWTGTYNIDHDPPVTHTMIYLGRRKKDGHRLMVGASDGRPYDGQRRNGVSVFDFRMPAARNGDKADGATAAAPDNAPDFAGYGPIPGMADRNDDAARRSPSPSSTPAKPADNDEEPGPSPTPARRRSGIHSPRT